MTGVYVISDGAHVKVGRAHNAERRRAELQIGSSRPLSLAFFLGLGSVAEAQRVERLAHERLAHLRLEGEWFNCDVETARLAVWDVANPTLLTLREPGAIADMLDLLGIGR